MPREVLVEFTTGRRKGQQGVMKSAAVAKKHDAKVLAFWPTNEPYKEKEDTVTAEREAMPAVAAAEKAAKAVKGDS